MDEELSGLVVFVAADAGLVVLCGFGHELAPAATFALGVDGECGVGVDADTLLGCQRAAVAEDELHVAADDDALAILKRCVQHIPTRVKVVLIAVADDAAGEHGVLVLRAVCVLGDGLAVAVNRVVDVTHAFSPCAYKSGE